jgi:hypothetical protein
MTTLPDDIVRYIAARDRQRDDRVNEILAALSERERRLVREAAVMGYVRGGMAAAPGKQFDIPKDSAIVWIVIDACRAFSDLYPTLAATPTGEQQP